MGDWYEWAQTKPKTAVGILAVACDAIEEIEVDLKGRSMAGKAAKSAAKLTAKQERFCQEYMIDLNGTQAATRAGYSAKTANEQSTRMLANVHIQNRISELQKTIQERTEITQDMVIAEYAKIAFANTTDVMEWGDTIMIEVEVDGEMQRVPFHGIKIKNSKDLPPNIHAAVKKVKQGKDGLEVEMHDKKGALDSIARHLGMFNDSLELKGKLEVQTLSELMDDLTD